MTDYRSLLFSDIFDVSQSDRTYTETNFLYMLLVLRVNIQPALHMAYCNVLGSERSFTKLIRVSCSVKRIRTKMKFAVNLSKQTTNDILN
jgi:hypothetical protein